MMTLEEIKEMVKGLEMEKDFSKLSQNIQRLTAIREDLLWTIIERYPAPTGYQWGYNQFGKPYLFTKD